MSYLDEPKYKFYLEEEGRRRQRNEDIRSKIQQLKHHSIIQESKTEQFKQIQLEYKMLMDKYSYSNGKLKGGNGGGVTIGINTDLSGPVGPIIQNNLYEVPSTHKTRIDLSIPGSIVESIIEIGKTPHDVKEVPSREDDEMNMKMISNDPAGERTFTNTIIQHHHQQQQQQHNEPIQTYSFSDLSTSESEMTSSHPTQQRMNSKTTAAIKRFLGDDDDTTTDTTTSTPCHVPCHAPCHEGLSSSHHQQMDIPLVLESHANISSSQIQSTTLSKSKESNDEALDEITHDGENKNSISSSRKISFSEKGNEVEGDREEIRDQNEKGNWETTPTTVEGNLDEKMSTPDTIIDRETTDEDTTSTSTTSRRTSSELIQPHYVTSLGLTNEVESPLDKTILHTSTEEGDEETDDITYSLTPEIQKQTHMDVEGVGSENEITKSNQLKLKLDYEDSTTDDEKSNQIQQNKTGGKDTTKNNELDDFFDL